MIKINFDMYEHEISVLTTKNQTPLKKKSDCITLNDTYSA